MKCPTLLTALAIVCALTGTTYARIIATVPNDDYATVQEAVDAAAAESDGGVITVKRNTYTSALTLRSDVTVRGEETAATIFRGGITAEAGGILERCTVTGQGALVSGVSGVEIRASIFRDISGTALTLQNAADFTVSNNTFYNNGTALSLSAGSGVLQANLFRNNSTAVSRDTGTGISYEVNFFDRQDQDPTETTTANLDPLFVAPGANDFHLAKGSPCIDGAGGAGLSDLDNTEADQGAYGGPDADPRPFPVSGLTVELNGDGTAATLSWSENAAYDITGYGVYYGPSETYGGTAADNGPSPLQVGTVTQLDVTGLPVSTTAPPAPANVQAFTGSGSVLLRWGAAADATGYRVHWGRADHAVDQITDVGSTLTHIVAGLTNGVEYRFQVESYGGTTHHFTVSALSSGHSTGSNFESALTTDVAVVASEVQGDISPAIFLTPEQVAGFPSLDDKGGCFLRLTSRDRQPRRAWWLALPLLLMAAIFLGKRVPRGLSLLCLSAVMALPVPARAEGPRWSVSARGGVLLPGEANWGDHYDSNVVPDWRVGLGVRVFPSLLLGVEGGYRKSTGSVETTASGQPLGRSLDQTLEVIPVQAFAEYDFRSHDDQLLVPYLGLGYSRYYYRHKMDEGDSVRGNQQGYHARAGLKLLLNRVDPTAARKARINAGVRRTYACLEAQYSRVDDFGSADADLGGWSFLAGVAVDF